ncbi:EAL domain-containing protein [Klebsiella aerogenes]|uniref:EAL and HDOD domain-containing protein n=1 Tax=Enterobacter asburiae TaxID=61645 RepID=UPI00328D3300
MFSFIARQPIFDRNKKMIAYELLYRDGMNNSFPDVSSEYATSKIISDQFLCAPIPRLTGKNDLFINVPHQMIINGTSEQLPADKVVIEILEDAVPDLNLLNAVEKMHALGFHFALDDFTLHKDWDVFLKYVSVLKFDIRSNTSKEILDYIQRKKPLLHGISFLAEKIENSEEFEIFKEAGFHLFQGYFFSKPHIVSNKSLTPHQNISLTLLSEVSKENPDLSRIEKTLKRDLTLSYKIMRYVRNVSSYSRNVTFPQKITLKDILLYIGNNELRRFFSIAVLDNTTELQDAEIYHTSMVRAKFCELIAIKIKSTCLPSDSFFCGLFSMLDAILGIPLEDLVTQLPLSDEVKNALCEQKGNLYVILKLVIHYELLDWENTSKLCQELGIDEFSVIESMQTAIKWADNNHNRAD